MKNMMRSRVAVWFTRAAMGAAYWRQVYAARGCTVVTRPPTARRRRCNRRATASRAAWDALGTVAPVPSPMTVIGRAGEHPMSQRSSGPAGPGGDDWPGDRPPERHLRPVLLLVIALLAAAAGAGIV